MNTTTVWFARASASQSRSGSSPNFAWPVTNVTACAMSRCVSGICADAAHPSADEIPGTTSTSMPAARSASTSSPPRPKMKGSPPLSRTTRLPLSAASTSRRWIWSCGTECSPLLLPTGTISADAFASSRMPLPTSLSAKITSAPAIRRAALIVSKSGSPGPAPTSATRPGAGSCVLPSPVREADTSDIDFAL